jgi:archaellum component FlaC
MIERMEQMTETMEDITEYLDQVYVTHEAYNKWINVATESIMSIQEDIKYLKNKRDCI